MLLRLISWPYFRKHAVRTLLTTTGVVLGVAAFTGVHTANESVRASTTNLTSNACALVSFASVIGVIESTCHTAFTRVKKR